MPESEILIVLQWWLMLFLLGVSFLPLTFKIFPAFLDRGYIFSKILAISILSYAIFFLATLHILSFSTISLIILSILLLVPNLIFIKSSKDILKKAWKIIFLEEVLFLICIFVWSYVRATQPDIHGLEKYMDFGFINSILRSDFFPPKDMWFANSSLNYYYFGHLVIAAITKLSNIQSSITYNLSIATIFALTFVSSFSIGVNLIKLNAKRYLLNAISGGFITAILVTFSGNLQTLYAFFKPYVGENATPFWQLAFSPNSFPNSYWYPNATRFIYHTIHEFPLYSFVVSDLHAHVLSLPFVLLTIAVLFSMFKSGKNELKVLDFKFLILSLLLSILYMTNTWDTVTYFFLIALVIFFINKSFNYLFLLGISTFLFTLPFNLFFKPFVSGVAVLCSPQFLTNVGSVGPLIFEANHCQHSPWWQLVVLYGFFYSWVIFFMSSFIKIKNQNLRIKKLETSDVFVAILILTSTILIIIPEFIYIKDIYVAHYRANTMFKFTYQAFIMLSIASGYIVTKNFAGLKQNLKSVVLLLIGGIGLFLVLLYPFFAINSYYNGLTNYHGLDGTAYLKTLYPNDYQAIAWLNKNVKGQPVILEAQGDSYTDYGRLSSNTGLPTVLGWTVHEWLWRGTYDITVPRISDVKTLYETADVNVTKQLLGKYKISFVIVGDLERQKYPNLDEQKFQELGTVVFKNGQTEIYGISY